MSLPDAITAIRSILEEQTACPVMELLNRTYLEFHLPSNTVRTALLKLQQQQAIAFKKTQVPDARQTSVSFIYRTNLPQRAVDNIIAEKSQLLAQHYDLSNEIGHHAENLVAQVCSSLGYTDIEIRKEKHGTEDLGMIGIQRRDIDVFAKHPTGNYYQNIEVKNRRDPLKQADLSSVMETTSLGTNRWKLVIKPALVTTFATGTALEAATFLDIPIAFSGGIYVPEERRLLYERLNSRLALNVKITDHPTRELHNNISTYITQHTYQT
jgi:hypothetical protein